MYKGVVFRYTRIYFSGTKMERRENPLVNATQTGEYNGFTLLYVGIQNVEKKL